jgi:acetyl esterase/lipase
MSTNHLRRAALALISCLALGSAATAQTSAVPPEVEQRVRELGPVINPPETAKLYAPLQEKEPYAGVKVTRDVKYGPDDHHVLDLFVAENAGAEPRPVLVMIHGGAFVAGSKHAPGSAFFDNIMLFAARHGMVGVNADYRLAPANPWPAGTEDMGALVNWVSANIAARGGDPARVFLMGHSAGAAHVAAYVASPNYHGPRGSGIAGAIFVSGLYDLTTFKDIADVTAYYGKDASQYAERSLLPGLLKSPTPLLVAYSELDPSAFDQQANQLRDALCKADRCPRFVFLPKHSHMSEVYSINTSDTELSNQILDLVKTVK